MKIPYFGLALCALVYSTTGQSIAGKWKSDCQNVSDYREKFASLAPIDTFYENGQATLLVHVYEESNCTGKEWDEENISCKYQVGAIIPELKDTRELDLECSLNGNAVKWYEIVEQTPNTIRYGNKTGTTPEDRPKVLGSVIYRLLNK